MESDPIHWPWSLTPFIGQSGGVRVIYFTRTAEEEVVLLLIYAKSRTDNITGTKLKEIRRVIEN